jgi:PEGA domain
MKTDPAKFHPVEPADTVANGAAEDVASLSAKLQLGSDSPGADIDVDGSFAGNTPSDVQMAEGEPAVAVQKVGFKDRERKLKVTGGSSVCLNAELEKLPSP